MKKAVELSRKFLAPRFSYFTELSSSAQEKFCSRALEFIEYHEFEMKPGVPDNTATRLLIGASAVQLTFGLDYYLFENIKRIIVHPEAFFLPKRRRKLKGGVTPQGYFAVSLKDFNEGYALPNDKINLGLHEMAHALEFQVLTKVGFDAQFFFYYQNWEDVGQKEFQNLRSRQPHFLRRYGGTNKREFFAICIEHFFEAPEQMLKELPQIYRYMALMLNQNPLNKEEDFVLGDDLNFFLPD